MEIISKCGIKVAYEAGDVIEFAAAELVKYLDLMQVKKHYAINLGISDRFFLESKIDKNRLAYDGFAIKTEGDKISICGLLERSVLFGVYELLTQSGCKFALSDISPEIIEEKDSLFVKDGLFSPDFEIRSLANVTVSSGDEWAEDFIRIIDISAKQKINSIFIHQSFPAGLTGARRKIADAIKKRGLILEIGGHAAQDLVPRTLFETKPHMFIEKDGVRLKSGNFCPSSSEALEVISKAIKDYVDENPEIDILHLWFDDVLDGSWCECSKCKHMTALQQQNLVVKTVIENLHPYHPDLKLDILLYHDTLHEVDKLSGCNKNLIGFYAPRERCYSHSIGDKSCANNMEYCEILLKAIKTAGADNLGVFEYYCDAILFSKGLADFPAVIAQDLIDYNNMGIKYICNLAFGKYSHWAYGLNSYVFAQHSFNTKKDLSKTRQEFFERLGGGDTSKIVDYYRELESFTSKYFAFCGYHNNQNDIRWLKLSEYTGEHLAKMEDAIKNLERAEHLIGTIKGFPEQYIRAEKQLLRVTLIETKGMIKRMWARWSYYKKTETNPTVLQKQFDEVKKGLYQIIEIFKEIPDLIGAKEEELYMGHLCKDQIWTACLIMNNELGIKTDLDRSKI